MLDATLVSSFHLSFVFWVDWWVSRFHSLIIKRGSVWHYRDVFNGEAMRAHDRGMVSACVLARCCLQFVSFLMFHVALSLRLMWGRCLIVLIDGLGQHALHPYLCCGTWLCWWIASALFGGYISLVSGQFSLVRKLNILVTCLLAGAAGVDVKLNILGCCLHCQDFIRNRRIS